VERLVLLPGIAFLEQALGGGYSAAEWVPLTRDVTREMKKRESWSGLSRNEQKRAGGEERMGLAAEETDFFRNRKKEIKRGLSPMVKNGKKSEFLKGGLF